MLSVLCFSVPMARRWGFRDAVLSQGECPPLTTGLDVICVLSLVPRFGCLCGNWVWQSCRRRWLSLHGKHVQARSIRARGNNRNDYQTLMEFISSVSVERYICHWFTGGFSVNAMKMFIYVSLRSQLTIPWDLAGVLWENELWNNFSTQLAEQNFPQSLAEEWVDSEVLFRAYV